jgi:hypothetical protein
MRSLTLRRAAIVAVVPLTFAALTACGTDSSTTAADPGGSPSSSATSPSASTSADSGDAGQTVDPAAFVDRLKTAAQALTTARFTMNMDLSGQSVQAKGVLDMTGDQPAMQISMDLTGMGTPTDMRIVDGVMYIQDPTSGSGKYLKMDLGDPNGPLAGLGDTMDSYNPNEMLGKLSPDTFQKVTDLGSDSVGGEQVEHYRVVLDTNVASQMLKNLPSTASLPRTVTYDMWLDSQDRMAKFTMLMKKVTQVTATYSDYGADVHVTAPDPSDVMEIPGSTTG